MAPSPLNKNQRIIVDAAQVAIKSRGYWSNVAFRIIDDKVTLLCGFLLLLIFLSAIFADQIAF